MRFLAIFISIVISGCSVTGHVGEIDFRGIENTEEIVKSLGDVTIISSEDAAINEAIGSFNWGGYDESDGEAIRHGVHQNIIKNSSENKEKYNIYIKIHRYAQTITNASYASFVVVDWSIEKDGVIEFEEVFYAGHSDELNIFKGKSLGWAKGVTQKSIITRVVNKSLDFSSDSKILHAYPEDHIYTDAEAAIQALPKELSSVGGGGVGGGYFYYVGSFTGETNFDKKAAYKKVDWIEYLSGLGSV